MNPPRPPRSATLFVRAAYLLLALDLAVLVIGGWCTARTSQVPGWLVFPISVALLIAPVTGLLVVRRHARNLVGWLLIAHGLASAVIIFGDGYAQYGGVVHPGRLPGAAWVALISDEMWPLLYLFLALIAYVFPDGRTLSTRWTRFVIGCLAGYAALIVVSCFSVDKFEGALAPLTPPLGHAPAIVIGASMLAGLVAIIASLVGAAVAARSRLRRSDGKQRLQVLWFAWASLSVPGALAICFLDAFLTGKAGALTVVAVLATGALLPASIGLAILRHGLFDIELVLSRTLTYGLLTALVVSVYAASLRGLGAFLNDSSAAGLIGVGIVAVAIQPVHARLRRRVERWIYGDRSDPYAALRRMSDRLESTLDPAQVLQTAAAAVAEALRAKYVAVELDRAEASASQKTSFGTPGTGDLVRIPLVHQGIRFGDLAVEVPRGRELGAADRRLLDDLAQHLAIVVNAVHLAYDLQTSRLRLVTAREEERRRLRRDLHDGLGPSLAAIVLKLDVVGALVDDEVAGRVLVETRNETRASIAEIRRLVDDLRPPLLDEVGLVAALRQRAASLSASSTASFSLPNQTRSSLVVDVDGPVQLPPMPAAVEVAAYRIATEALTNVVRHSGAARCSVTLVVNGGLEVSVADNGDGPPHDVRAGVGWTSMRERAAELGGSCTITRRPEGGTIVTAQLPLPHVLAEVAP
jgi:two-component system, NarL family, sensor kinase